jgi:hypothetical protein
LRAVDAHIRRRLRAIIIRQRKRPRFLFRHLRSRGASIKAAGLVLQNAAQGINRLVGVVAASNPACPSVRRPVRTAPGAGRKRREETPLVDDREKATATGSAQFGLAFAW